MAWLSSECSVESLTRRKSATTTSAASSRALGLADVLAGVLGRSRRAGAGRRGASPGMARGIGPEVGSAWSRHVSALGERACPSWPRWPRPRRQAAVAQGLAVPRAALGGGDARPGGPPSMRVSLPRKSAEMVRVCSSGSSVEKTPCLAMSSMQSCSARTGCRRKRAWSISRRSSSASFWNDGVLDLAHQERPRRLALVAGQGAQRRHAQLRLRALGELRRARP